MPRIQPYTQQIGAQGEIPGRSATAADFGGGIGESLFALGQTGVRVAAAMHEADERRERERKAEEEKLLAKQKQDELLKASVEVAKGRSYWYQWLIDAQDSAPADGAGFTRKFNDEFTKYKDKALESVTLPEVRQRYEADLEGLRATLTDNAVNFERTARAKAFSSGMQQAFDANINTVLSSPTKVSEIMAEELRLISLAPGPQHAKATLAKQREQALWGASAEGSLMTLLRGKYLPGLKEFQEDLLHNDGELSLKKRLDSKAYEALLERTRRAIDALSGSENVEYKRILDERIKERASGYTDNGLSVVEARGDPQATRAITSAIEIGDARRAVSSVSFADAGKMVNDAVARLRSAGNYTADALYADAVVTAVRERDRAFADDPANYTLQNSETVRRAYETMVSGNYSPQSVRDYQSVMLAEQQRLGAPAHVPRMLPKSEIDAVASELASVPAENVVDRMQSLRQKYGPMWGEIRGELQVQGKIRPEYMTLARLDAKKDAVVVVDLAEAIKSNKELRANLAEQDAKTIDDKVEVAMQPYARTLSYAGAAGQNILRGEMQSAKLLAYLYRSRDTDINEAVKKATNSLLFDRYDVGGTYLAPKGELGKISRETERLMRETPESLFVPAASNDPNMSEDYRRRAAKSSAMQGFWANITDPATDQLGIEWRNSQNVPVILNNGQRVRILFDDFRKLPPPAPPEVRRGTLNTLQQRPQGGE